MGFTECNNQKFTITQTQTMQKNVHTRHVFGSRQDVRLARFGTLK
jgi:hypothetical protein